jgi:phosphatidate cytidylyltransferase
LIAVEIGDHQIDYPTSFPLVGLTLSYTGILGSLLVVAVYSLSSTLLLWLMIVVAANDTAAFFGGRAMGVTKLAPRISPGKTRAGLAWGLIGAVAAGLVFAKILRLDGALISFGLIALGCALFAVAGDLAESLLKRSYGVKDSGTLLPGHGGVLDRVDAFIFALPGLLLFSLNNG